MEDDQFRRHLVASMVANGVDPDEARLAADIATHAVRQALESFQRVTNRLENRLEGSAWSNAYAIGLQLLGYSCTQRHEEFAARADKLGLKARAFSVGDMA